jgi:LysM repeat protein
MHKVLLILGLVLLLQLALVPASSAAPPPSGGFWHYVRHGETLFSIGRLYGVNAHTICSVNGLGNCNRIRAGQALWIPGQQGPGPGHGCSAVYRVKHGDTLHSISRHYGVNAWRIASANGIHNLNLIYAGQRLCIP